MRLGVFPYGTAVLTLVTSGVMAVTPASPPDLHGPSAAVRLTSSGTDWLGGLNLGDLGGLASLPDLGGVANIPLNLFTDIVNIPYNEFQAIGIYADALGSPGSVGMDPGTGMTDPYYLPGSLVPYDGTNPILAPIGVDHALVPVGVAGTGSYWMESIGNTWGWDDGNFAQLDGIANMLIPFPAFEQPFADELQAITMAEIVADPPACPFACSNLPDYLGGWFKVPLTQLLSGYTLPSDISPADEPLSWSGQTIQLDPAFPFTNFFTSLTADPSYNPIQIPTPQDIVAPLTKLAQDLYINDFNPFAIGAVPGDPTETGTSFLYWGAPILYSVPSIIGGMVQDVTGIPNPFSVPVAGDEVSYPIGISGVIPGLIYGFEHLPSGLAQGFEYLVQGLGAYLDPGAAASLSAVADPSTLLADLSGLLGTAALPGDLGASLSGAGVDLGSLLGSDLAANLDPLQFLGF